MGTVELLVGFICGGFAGVTICGYLLNSRCKYLETRCDNLERENDTMGCVLGIYRGLPVEDDSVEACFGDDDCSIHDVIGSSKRRDTLKLVESPSECWN
jgi:hypothetical protein